jgi:hypothetical protein
VARAPSAADPGPPGAADPGPPGTAPVTTGGDVPASGAARSTVRLRRLSRTIAPEVGREAADSSGADGVTGRRVAARQVATPAVASTAAPALPTVTGTTDATRLAALSGGSMVPGTNGHATVVFAPGGQRPPPTPRAMPTATVQRAAPEPVAAPAAIDVDDLYDQIAARLRRELLLDRERAGELP